MSKKQKTAITPTRAENFPLWYQEVVKAADMAENAPVRGCMIMKPYGYAIWENMQAVFDRTIKALGVENVYFPLLIPLEFMSREAEHVDGFAKECAVVTHHRLEADPESGALRPAPSAKLEEPYIIRPTSETIIGDAMARWVQSYRDLPLKLNQWCNVMRWEMRPRLFLRTSEFLWQEGHNAFADEQSAREDAHKMLEAYADFAENTLAIPVIKGEKTADERFPGADMTLTIEAMMQDGKALQAGTSHYLGDNFARSCEIKYQDRNGKDVYAHTTSWGISTRLVGAMIMTHGDDDGMIMPPRIAPHQVGIVPVIKNDADHDKIMAYVEALQKDLMERGIRVFVDRSARRTPDKIWRLIKQGVPVRAEVGAREVEDGTVTHVRRDLGRDSKTGSALKDFVAAVPAMLDDIHETLFKRAQDFQNSNIHDVADLDALEAFFTEERIGFARLDQKYVDDTDYEKIKKAHGLSSRCMPFSDDGRTVLVGKAY